MNTELSLPEEAATLRLGAALAEGARGGLVLHLSGELGAGKTTLVRGLLEALGHRGRVRSPTYTLVEPYIVSRLHFYHFDFYRIKGEAEWLRSGFQEHFGPETLCVVEWPERAGGSLPPPDVLIRLEHANSGRLARVSAHSPAGEAWLAAALSRWRSS